MLSSPFRRLTPGLPESPPAALPPPLHSAPAVTAGMAPNPLDASTYNHRFVTVHSGNRYHLVDQPPTHWRGSVEEAPTILMCHGFPDLWYGWRYRESRRRSIGRSWTGWDAHHLLLAEIAAFAARGFRVLCPSQLGYGGSSQPGAVEAYSYKSVAYDMNGLLDAVGAGKVIVFGHDWCAALFRLCSRGRTLRRSRRGGMVAWRFADYFPHRVICIARCACSLLALFPLLLRLELSADLPDPTASARLTCRQPVPPRPTSRRWTWSARNCPTLATKPFSSAKTPPRRSSRSWSSSSPSTSPRPCAASSSRRDGSCRSSRCARARWRRTSTV